ncbi:MAG: 2-oxoacid:acceptor oxidoreductase family protein [Intestinibacillus sp.]
MNIVLAGFGGQGVLFAGKIIAHAGLLEDREVSWLPSYGPEMRGGTANCSVCLSDEPVGCPLVLHPDLLIAMNRPSFEKFSGTVAPGGVIVYDSALIEDPAPREDVRCAAVPASRMAESEEGLGGLSNMILLGRALAETGFAALDAVVRAVQKCVPAKKQYLAEPNLRALHLGMST